MTAPARAVLLTEDESQAEFIRGIMPKIADLDALSVSILDVGSETGYGRFLALCKELDLPVIALKDKAWGDATTYPDMDFFSLGMEIEDYQDTCGLASQRRELVKNRGTSKARIQRELGQLADPDEVPIIAAVIRRAAELAK